MRLCDHIERYCDGDRVHELDGAFAAHLKECQACASKVEKWSLLKSEIEMTVRESEEALPKSSEAQIQSVVERARLGAKPAADFIVPLRPALALAAALAAVFVAYVFMRAPEPKTNSATEYAEEKTQAEAPFEMAARLLVSDEKKILPLEAVLNEPIEAPENGRVLVSLGPDQIGGAPEALLTVIKSTKKYTLIRLERGTALFSVSPRDGRGEFIVEAKHLKVRVVGTKFAVSTQEDKSEVSLIEGAVEVTSTDNRTFNLDAGQHMVAARSGEASITWLSEEDAARLMILLGEEFEEPLPEDAEEADDHAEAREEDGMEPAAAREQHQRNGFANRKGSIETWREWVIEGRFDEAASALETHLKRKPKDEAAWSLLADCRRKSGDWRGAVDAYNEVIGLTSGGRAEQARFRAGALLQDKLHAHKEAVAMFDDYIESGRSDNSLVPEALYRLARSHLALGHREKALYLLEEVTERHRGSPAAAKAMGLIEKLKSGD